MGKRDFLRAGDRTRVLINGIHAKSGGGVTYLRNVLPLMAARDDLDLHLFLHRKQFDLFYPFPEGVRVHVLDFDDRFFRMMFWEQLVLPFLARSMHVDVTFSPANYGPLMAPGGVILLRNSLAVSVRERRLSKRLYWFGLAVITALSLLTARRSIAVSGYAKRALSFGVGRLLRAPVAVVPHGISPIFSPGPENGPEGDYLLAVSDIYVQKNFHSLFRALGVLRNEHPDLILKIAGRIVDESYHAELMALADELGVSDRLEFLGNMSAEGLLELYRRCRLFVFPSTVETFGNPLVEAMACGAPVVSSNTAAMPEIVGDAALLVDPLDPPAMADAIDRVLSDDALRAELRRKGLARASGYSWENTVRDTTRVLKEASARG